MILTVGLYLALTLVVGVALSARVKSVTDYLVAGRGLGLALSTASLAAVQIGAGVVLGGAENGAADGLWPGMWYGLGCGAGLILAGLVAAHRMRAIGGYVPIDFFAHRYGEHRGVRLWAWMSNIPSLLGIFAAQLMASGSVLAGLGMEFTHGVLLIAAVILVSNTLSGMWGVVAVDFLQVAVIMVGVPLAAVAAVMASPAGSLPALVSTPFVPPGMGSRAVFLITPFLVSISVSYDAFIRYQSARSASIARWACILSGVLVIVASASAAVIGAAGQRAFPSIEHGAVLTHVVRQRLPAAAGGIVMAALLAAAMSTANALLISLAGCFSRDFYNKVLHPSRELEELPHATRYARVAVVAALVLGVTTALRARGILDTIILFNYPYMASMLVPLLGGLLWRGATRTGAYAAMWVGGVIGVVGFLAGIPGPFKGIMNVDLALLLAFGVSAVVFVIASRAGLARTAVA